MRKIFVFITVIFLPVNLFSSSLSMDPAPVPEPEQKRSVFRSSYSIGGSGSGGIRLSLAGREGIKLQLLSARRGYGFDGTFEPGSRDYSTGGIIARNVLLPGLGQRKMGQRMRSRIYFFLEGAAWVGLGTFFWQKMARTGAYEEYAVAYAGVEEKGLSEDYYETIGNFMSSDGPGGYNEYVMREARDLYYPDQEAIQDYYEANALTGDQSWRWLSESTYDKYNSLRKGANSSERRAVYSLFFMLGLRLISNIDAVRSIMTDEGDQEQAGQGGAAIDIHQNGEGISVVLKRPF
ncbi:MAG: hypothetical protein R6U43_01665 [Candidatus Krumholzibacteriales bacterium]